MSFFPDTGVEWIVAAITLVVAGTAAFSLWMTALALRAKHRAYFALHPGSDPDFEKLLRLLKDQQISLEEQERMCRLIEEKLLNRLSEQDRRFILQGLHQQSRAGAQRYIKELAGA